MVEQSSRLAPDKGGGEGGGSHPGLCLTFVAQGDDGSVLGRSLAPQVDNHNHHHYNHHQDQVARLEFRWLATRPSIYDYHSTAVYLPDRDQVQGRVERERERYLAAAKEGIPGSSRTRESRRPDQTRPDQGRRPGVWTTPNRPASSRLSHASFVVWAPSDWDNTYTRTTGTMGTQAKADNARGTTNRS